MTAVAKALYMEMTRYGATSQMILIPPTYNAAKGLTEKPRVLTRKVSEAHPRRNWRTQVTRREFDAAPTVSAPPATAVVEATLPLLEELGDYIAGYQHGGWEIRKAPIVVDMSYEDLCDITERKTPQALIRRITRARDEAGFPAELFGEPKVVATPVVEEPVAPVVLPMAVATEEPKPIPAMSNPSMFGMKWETPDGISIR